MSHKGGFPAVISPHFQASAANIGGQSSLSKLPAPVTGVKDESGELQAYTVERECKRVMREFFGMAIPEEDDKAIIAAKDVVHGMLASSNTPAESR